MTLSKLITASDLTVKQLFSDKMTDIVCVNIDQAREIWVATLMCAQYLESHVDSIIVRDDSFKPVGIVGGFELLNYLRDNPTRDYQYSTKVGEIMRTDLAQVDNETKLSELIDLWKNSARAFSIMTNEYGDCSTISARRMLQVGTKCETDLSISALHSSNRVNFAEDASMGEVLDLMYEYNVRKLLLEDTTQFISDRLILSEISKILQFQPDIDHFLDLPVSKFKLADAATVTEDLGFNELCLTMEAMDHPLVVYNDMVLTPWDVCLALNSSKITISRAEDNS